MSQVKLNEFARISYSQFAEDLYLESVLFPQKADGFYVDVGAHHPYRFSNTCLFHKRGWRGINVDVDQRAIDLFKVERPADTNVLAAIGRERGERTLFLFNEGAVNTLSPELAEEYARIEGRTIIDRKPVPVYPLGDILDQYLPDGQAIDILNIDIEGLDMESLESNNWEKYRPEVIVIEIHTANLFNIHDLPATRYLVDKGYHVQHIAHLSTVFRKIR